MLSIESIDIRGNLETIEHLAQIGMLMIDQNYPQHIPTILEDICEHSQRLTLEYAVVQEEKDATDE